MLEILLLLLRCKRIFSPASCKYHVQAEKAQQIKNNIRDPVLALGGINGKDIYHGLFHEML